MAVVWTILDLIFSFLTIILNVFLMLLLVRVKHFRTSRGAIFRRSLSLSDFLVGVLTTAISLLPPTKDNEIIGILHVLRMAFTSCSLLTVVLLSSERWYTIHYPIARRRQSLRTAQRVSATVVWFWALIVHIPAYTLNAEFVCRNETAAGVPNGTFLPDVSLGCLQFRSSIFYSVFMPFQNLLLVIAVALVNYSVYRKIVGRKRSLLRRSMSSASVPIIHNCLVSPYGMNEPCRENMQKFRRSSCPVFRRYSQTTPKRGIMTPLPIQLTAFRTATMNVYPQKHFISSKIQEEFDFDSLRESSESINLSKRFSADDLSVFSFVGSRECIKMGKDRTKHKLVKEERRAGLRLGLMVVTVILCFMLQGTISIARFYTSALNLDIIDQILFLIPVVNSSVNPALYTLATSRFSKRTMRLRKRMPSF